MGNSVRLMGNDFLDRFSGKNQNPNDPYSYTFPELGWWGNKKNKKAAPTVDRIDASPTLSELWRRRGMIGQKAMDKSGTRYQIGG